MRPHLVCALGFAVAATACGEAPTPQRLNFVLFVLDTTRFDAVGGRAGGSGSTPSLDELASAGLLYTRAFAPSPWTLPSHVSLFTGLLPSQHGAGWKRTHAGDELATIAERLREAGYETFGVSENPWVSSSFNLDQGFEELAFVGTEKEPGVVGRVERWLSDRGDAPFFLFVNVIDPHAPYTMRSEALPRDVGVVEALRISQDPSTYNCSNEATPERMRVLRALYQGDVAAADAKLGAVMQAVRRAQVDARTVTIVVSDHGEHFGENRLVSHQFSVRNALLHVPLVVHGLPDVEPGVIDRPVSLVDVSPSMLSWADLEITAGAAGRPLPVSNLELPASRSILAEYEDPTRLPLDSEMARWLLGRMDEVRANCGREDRVFGTMRSVIRYPFKLVEYEEYPPELFDLERDPQERRDLAASQHARVAELAAALEPREDRAASPQPPPEVRDEILEALEALGYVGSREAPGTGN